MRAAAGGLRRRDALTAVAAILVLVRLLPPVGTYARQYVFVESRQFVLFATVAPALLVLGAPWRLLGRGGRERSAVCRMLAAGHGAARRPGGRDFGRALAALLAFMGAVILWRLPVTVNALARTPGLAVAELATLGAAGSALWLELVESPPLRPRLSRPQRAAFAAIFMWTIWALAYSQGPDEERRAMVAGQQPGPRQARLPRPPRGWRTPSS